MLKIAVVDGQGGGIGALIVKSLRESFGESLDITALGTNSAATAAMMKAKANRGATGENAIVWNSGRVDVITGPVSVVLANGMLGEVTPKMAEALSSSRAEKLLLPLNQELVTMVGLKKEPLPHLIDELINLMKEKYHVRG
ncbi:MAG: DUF3842 family protein [Nitrospirae bacterium]|nr:DUF3842 family protein [Nitrospirota bacterium]